MDHSLHEKCSADRKIQENGFPKIPTCASIALDKQSNLNYGSKFFFFVLVLGRKFMLTSVENDVIILHIFMQLMSFKYDRLFFIKYTFL
jgi:hypothetical protein